MGRKVCAVSVLLLALVTLLCLSGCGTDVNTSGDETEDTGSITYKLGEKVTIKKDGKDLYTLTINKVIASEHRNEFWDKNPNQVITINYTYENIANEENLYISSINFKVIDADGNVCETYPLPSGGSHAQSVPMGARFTADECYGLMSDKKETKIMFYDNIFNSKADATFELTAE